MFLIYSKSLFTN